MPNRSQRHKEEIQGTSTATGPVIGAWTAGAGTVTPVPIAAGRAKCESTSAGTNPRIITMVTGLVPGKDYRLNTQHYYGPDTAFYRVDDEPTIPDGTYGQFTANTSGPIALIFTAPPSGTVYIGVVQIVTAAGQFCETSAVFQLTRLT